MNDNRTFHYAVAASLVLHAAALFGLPDMVDRARRAAAIPPQLIARLMEPEPQPERVVEQPPAVQKQPQKKPTPRLAKPRAPVAPPVVSETPLPEPAEIPPAEPAPAPPSAPVAAVEPSAPAASAPPASAPEAPELLSRDQYRVQLLDEARRHKRYPPLARENNWQGNVRVGVAVAPSGRATVTLRGSSGYDVLDRQALEMFNQAARAVPVPPALRGKEFSLEVRAIYGLED